MDQESNAITSRSSRQNRISNLSVLAPGKQMLPLPVSCVERGRWSYRSREFAESPDIMFSAGRAKKARAVSLNMARNRSRVSDQGMVWEDIDELSSKLGYASPTSAMQDVYTNRRTSVEEYLRDVSVADGQVGAIFAINGTAAGMELFDSTDRFAHTFRRFFGATRSTRSQTSQWHTRGLKMRRRRGCLIRSSR